MKLKFFKVSDLDRNLRATIHKTGKLGFTIEAAKKMGFEVGKGADIAVNEEDTGDQSLYIVILDSKAPDSFLISKSGAYYYINAKPLFDQLKLNYSTENIRYAISEMDESWEGKKVYKLSKKESSKKSTEIESN